MTEFSYWWTTSGTPAGDQVASYTQVHLARIAAVLAACSGFEGIAPGYLDELAGTVAGANTVEIATGGAVVDGKVYDSDAAVNVNIPSASGGGNTRIDRIVLRVSWAGFTARLTRIAGTDAASPTAPAITQTSGTTYDILLYQALVNTSGTVTLTDERVWALRPGERVLLQTLAGTGSSGTILFSSIPQYYQELLIVGVGRSSRAAANVDPIRARLNGDSGTNYDFTHVITEGAATIASDALAGQTSILVGQLVAANGEAGSLDGFTIRLPFYRNGSHKTVRSEHAGLVTGVNTTYSSRSGGGRWQSTAAINSVSLILDNGNFTTATDVKLYGIV